MGAVVQGDFHTFFWSQHVSLPPLPPQLYKDTTERRQEGNQLKGAAHSLH